METIKEPKGSFFVGKNKMSLRDIAVGAMRRNPWLETAATAFRLPEMGVSEQAAGYKPTQWTSSNALANWEAQNFLVGPGGGGGAPAPTTPPPSGGKTLGVTTPTSYDNRSFFLQPGSGESGGPSVEDLVNAEYASANSQIAALEAQYKREMPLAQARIGSEYEAGKGEMEAREAGQLGELAGKRTETQLAEKSAISKVRQLYNDLQRQRIAELSAQGISSSSAAEGSMELLGRSTAQEMGGIRQTALSTLGEIQKEESGTKNWYNTKLTELQTQKNQALQELENKYLSSLDQISTIRAQSEEARALKRYDAMVRAKEQAFQIEQWNAKMAFDLQRWATDRMDTLNASRNRVLSEIKVLMPSPTELAQLRGLGLQATGFSPKEYGGGYYLMPSYGEKEEEMSGEEGGTSWVDSQLQALGF